MKTKGRGSDGKKKKRKNHTRQTTELWDLGFILILILILVRMRKAFQLYAHNTGDKINIFQSHEGIQYHLRPERTNDRALKSY